MDPFKCKGQQERQRVKEALKTYPHSFQMKDMDIVSNKTFSSLKKHLEAGLKAGYNTSLEMARVRNLLAFTLFKLEEHNEALEQTEAVLETDEQENNIVSLANKAYILNQLGNIDEADETVAQLKEIEIQDAARFDYLMVLAKGEQAASYMRFGPRFYQHATDTFLEVLPHAREPEVWAWKFGLAVTYRHSLDLQCIPYARHGRQPVTPEDILKLLQEVSRAEAVSANLKANAYAEIGLLLDSMWDKKRKTSLGFQAETGPMASCKRALELDNSDASVLWKVGKIYRHNKDLFGSKKHLERSVQLQPSSAAYHHLGLTYKAMATNAKYGKLKTRRGGKRQKERKRAREEKMRRQQAEGGTPAEREPQKSLVIGGSARKNESGPIDRIRKAVKSANKSTEFDPEDENVRQAFKYLKEALEFSCDENSRAMYDLALLHKATRQFREALKYFDKIIQRKNGGNSNPSGLLDQVTALEQKGLIFKEQADEEEDRSRKGKLINDGKKSLYRALEKAAEFYSNVSEVKDHFAQIFHSPSALLREAVRCEERAAVFSLMNNHKQSLALLNEIAEQERNEQFYKTKLICYEKAGEFEEAVACLALLKPTEMHSKVMKLFENPQGKWCLNNIYIQAGRKALLDGSYTGGYFDKVFRESVDPPDTAVPDAQPTAPKRICPEYEDDCNDLAGAAAPDPSDSAEKTPNVYDIMLLHDEEDDYIEGKAKRLRDVLRRGIHLEVVRRDDNYPEGTLPLNNIDDNIERSRLVVVLPGQKTMTPMFENNFVGSASQRKNTVVLLTEGIVHGAIPRQLRLHRVLQCPPQLLGADVDLTRKPYSEATVDSICQLFKFLIDTEQ